MATVQQKPHGGRRILLHGVSWEAYRRLLRAFDEKRHLRITFDRGTLEIMTLSPKHERSKHLLGLLIVTLAEELRMNIAGFGSMTFKRRRKQRGLEPDECYWIEHESLMRDKDTFDWESDPVPDLLLEIDDTSSSVNRLAIYEALRVTEVWRWDGQVLRVYLLGSDGKYQVVERSRAFPFLRAADLIPFLKMAATAGEIGMLHAFRDWVRQQQALGWPTPAAESTSADGHRGNGSDEPQN